MYISAIIYELWYLVYNYFTIAKLYNQVLYFFTSTNILGCINYSHLLYIASPVPAVHGQPFTCYTQLALNLLYIEITVPTVHRQPCTCCTQLALYLLYIASPEPAVHSQPCTCKPLQWTAPTSTCEESTPAPARVREE